MSRAKYTKKNLLSNVIDFVGEDRAFLRTEMESLEVLLKVTTAVGDKEKLADSLAKLLSASSKNNALLLDAIKTMGEVGLDDNADLNEDDLEGIYEEKNT